MGSAPSQSATPNTTQIPPLISRTRRGASIENAARKVEQFMWTYPTAEVTARFFDTGTQTLYRWIKRHYGLTFDEFRDKNLSQTKHTLVQKALDMALTHSNVRALELCLRNLCGWDAESAQMSPERTAITLRYSLDTPRDVTPSPTAPE